MTKILLLLFFPVVSQAQVIDTAAGYFDNDEKIDSISYHLERTPVEGSSYVCELHLGNGKIRKLSIGVVFES
ncbi:MAG: hypothetical protein ABI378_01120 [Chitinophagaceae bacterium]